MADLSGVQRNYIANLERGAISVPRDPENLRALAKALKVGLRAIAEPTGWYDDEAVSADWKTGLREEMSRRGYVDEDIEAVVRSVELTLSAKERSA